jgi:ABC-type nitrate/sulfonate/bicarbonate transport system substrate-binding protein
VLKANIVKSYLGMSIPHSLLIANRKFAETRRDVVTRFIAAINDATQYLRRNPSEAVYALQRNTTLLGHGHWAVDKVVVEKAGEFVGKINTVDLFSEQSNRAEALDELKNYGEMLRTHGMADNQVNLSHWLGVDKKDSTVTSLQ